MSALVEASGLSRTFAMPRPWLARSREAVTAVDQVSFAIAAGETFAVVGESGSGKSTLARLIVGLLRPTKGELRISGSLRPQMIFQDASASLNPRWSAERIIAEPIRAYSLLHDEKDIRARVAELLILVGLNPHDAQKYPRGFSGGQRQRIAIARALASQARFIVCDEPTSALDASVQAQILNLMRDLQERLGLTYLFISHNLAVVRYMADRIAVMYRGRIVEIAGRDALFLAPRHPYTRRLLAAVPDLEETFPRPLRARIDIADQPLAIEGCAYHPRCPFANERCRLETPLLLDGVACHGIEEGRIDATTVL